MAYRNRRWKDTNARFALRDGVSKANYIEFNIRRTRKSPPLRFYPGQCIQALSLMEEVRSDVLSPAKHVSEVLSLMDGSISNVLLQEWGCVQLYNVSKDPQNWAMISEKGGVRAVMEAVREHMLDPDISLFTFKMLLNLTESNGVLTNEEQMKGVETVVAVMKTHVLNPALIYHALELMMRLTAVLGTSNDDRWESADEPARMLKIIVEKGGIEAVVTQAVVDLLNALITDPFADTDTVLNTEAMGNKAAMVKAGVVGAVVGMMRVNRGDMKMSEEGCTFLSNVVVRRGENNRVLVAEGGLEEMVEAMRTHRVNEEIQARGCRTFYALALEGTHLQAMIDTGCWCDAGRGWWCDAERAWYRLVRRRAWVVVSAQEKRIAELTTSLGDRNAQLQKFQSEKKAEMEALMSGMKSWISNLDVKNDMHKDEFEKGLQRLVDTSSFDNGVWQVMTCASASAAKQEELYQTLKGQYDELQQRNAGGVFGQPDQRVGEKRRADGEPDTSVVCTPDIWSNFIADVSRTGYQVM
ncbi:hypothetical protein T484DRAFT_1858687 [Baffinella frigidus]|nr:hypothetical protein T484DRAFT_1858687 [Cryptophyta sp. CCMP2293]